MSDTSDQDFVSAPRRAFVKSSVGAVAGSALLNASPALAQAAQAVAKPAFPVVDIARLDALKDEPLAFTYPDGGSPALLVRLAEGAPGGVGPGNRIVAYSILCTHKGCPVAWRPERRLFVCPCHWSSFDPAKAGQMVIGQGSHALPQVQLRVSGGTIQAIGIDGLIYGRHTNIL